MRQLPLLALAIVLGLGTMWLASLASQRVTTWVDGLPLGYQLLVPIAMGVALSLLALTCYLVRRARLKPQAEA
jgi:hypothetical protein